MKVVDLQGNQVVKRDMPKLLGMRGATNDGIQLVFDRPVALNENEQGSNIWSVPWETIGRAVLLLNELDRRISR